MKCSIPNLCKTKYLCCHYCDNKQCEFRCLDNREGCKYAIEGKYSYEQECTEIKEKQSYLFRLAQQESERKAQVQKRATKKENLGGDIK